MSLRIADQIAVSITINGRDCTLASRPGDQLYIISNSKYQLPQLKIYIDDMQQNFDRTNPLNDGTIVTISAGDGTNAQPPALRFRTFGTPKRSPSKNVPGINTYELIGLLDYPLWLRASPDSAFVGSSSTVLKQIAASVGLNLVSNANTNDAMTWLPGTRTWAKFAAEIARHAYVDDKSAMTTAVDEQANLYFHNVTDLYTGGSVTGYIYYGGLAKNDYANRKFLTLPPKAINRSGLHNYWTGYTMRTNQLNANGTPITNEHVNATTVNNNLDRDIDVAKQVEGVGRLAFAPADCGNTHTNYITARHQNIRLLGTYNQNVYALLNAYSGFKLFDIIQYTAVGLDGQPDASVSGLYVISAINRFVNASRYYEKIELVNAGPSDANTSLGSA